MRAARLVLYFLVGLMLGGVSVLSFAETIPATSTPNTPSLVYRVNNYEFSYARTALSACQAINGTVLVNNGNQCFRGGNETGNGTYLGNISTTTTCIREDIHTWIPCTGNTYSCPTGQNWTLSGTTCTRPDCVPPEVRDPATGACKPPPCPAAGTKNNKIMTGSGAMPNEVCSAENCTVTTGFCGGGSGKWWCDGGTYTGASCTGGEGSGSLPTPTPVNPSSPEGDCIKSGQGYGTVNGVVVCVPPEQTKSTTSSTKTSKDPSGQASTSTSTTSTVCGGDGSCTSTTTTTSVGGTTTTTTTGDKSAVCADNPKDPACVAAGGDGGMNWGVPSEGGKLEEKTIGVSSITPVTLASNNSCPAPLTLPRGWGSIDLKPACDLADLIRPLVLICAWLSAGLIVLGAFKSE